MQNEIDTKTFCINLKILRIKNKLSKKEMAKKLHICVNTLSTLENEVIPPRLKANIINYLYDNFKVTPDNMFKSVFL